MSKNNIRKVQRIKKFKTIKMKDLIKNKLPLQKNNKIKMRFQPKILISQVKADTVVKSGRH